MSRWCSAAADGAVLPSLTDGQHVGPRHIRNTRPLVRSLQGLDGFWRWVLEGLHAGAPDLFPGTGLPGEASGFEEAFSAVRHALFALNLGFSSMFMPVKSGQVPAVRSSWAFLACQAARQRRAWKHSGVTACRAGSWASLVCQAARQRHAWIHSGVTACHQACTHEGSVVCDVVRGACTAAGLVEPVTAGMTANHRCSAC